MRKAKKHEHVNHERWLVSYADFITLLFAFFVVMFSVSQVDSKKLGWFVESVNFAFQFKGPVPENQGSPLARGGSAGKSIVPSVVADRPSFLPYRAPSRQAKTLRETLEERLAPSRSSGEVELRYDPRGVALSLPESAYFYSGTAELRPAALGALRAIGEAISEESVLPVQVEAHTAGDAQPAAAFGSSWELSAARAALVADFLAEVTHVAPSRLSATGLAQHHPRPAEPGAASPEPGGWVDLVLITSTETD